MGHIWQEKGTSHISHTHFLRRGNFQCRCLKFITLKMPEKLLLKGAPRMHLQTDGLDMAYDMVFYVGITFLCAFHVSWKKISMNSPSITV